MRKPDEAVVHWATAQAYFERSFGKQQAAHLRTELFHMTGNVYDRKVAIQQHTRALRCIDA
ncbi:hypothetical protein SAMN05446935_8453 [Burkholderia sp. YR290]|nr:hypothetical protein SAMN05446935_8453 [Burkholderia sp. YR290]